MVALRPESKTEFEKLLESAGSNLVVIDFFATWCGPCKLMAPKFNKMSEEFTNATFIMIDVDEQDDICEGYDIKVMPTFVLVKDKKQIHVVEGNVVDELRKAIEENL